jgi:hypothetical protein
VKRDDLLDPHHALYVVLATRLSLYEVERPLMRPLPDVAPDLGMWAQARVHRDCHLQFQKSLYSVPFGLIGRKLGLRATDTTVTIFSEHQLVASHLRAKSIGTRRTVPEHLPSNAQLYFAHDRHWCAEQAEPSDLRAHSSSTNF